MMVIAVGRRIVFTAHVNDCVTCREDGRITSSNEGGGVVGWEEAKKVDGEGFGGMEVTIVGTYQKSIALTDSFEALSCLLGCHYEVAEEHV